MLLVFDSRRLFDHPDKPDMGDKNKTHVTEQQRCNRWFSSAVALHVYIGRCKKDVSQRRHKSLLLRSNTRLTWTYTCRCSVSTIRIFQGQIHRLWDWRAPSSRWWVSLGRNICGNLLE